MKTDRASTYRLVVPITNEEEASVLLPLAGMIASKRGGQITVLVVTIANKGEALSEATGIAAQKREEISRLTSELIDYPIQIRSLVIPTEETWDGIWRAVSEDEASLLLLNWRSDLNSDKDIDYLNDPRLVSPICDVVFIRANEEFKKSQNWSDFSRILLPVRGGVNAALALRVGYALADSLNGQITLLHITSRERRDDEEAFVNEFTPAMRGLEAVSRSITIKGEITSNIIAESSQHDVIVMGAPSRMVWEYGWSGPILNSVKENTNSILVVVKEGNKIETDKILDKEVESYPVERPVNLVVDKWFAENTYLSREFANLERLIALKEEKNLQISLGLPALNEAKTVGKVIKTVKSNLMDDFPLLDEIVLIDSGSVDYTREIAESHGIPVYIHQKILPEYGSFHGKGEALWKSLYILSGDIIAWIDTDIKNIHPRFVFGIIGPLLLDDRIQYVKGFYRRPLKNGDKVIAGGGGRVTELTARPLLNLFYPELSGIIQPLSGEYAGRRSALERLNFFTGYGVETGILIDVLQEFGLQGIAQVDLLKRIHHNQPLPSLSKMSFAIMQVIFQRLERTNNIEILKTANRAMNLIKYEFENYHLESEEIQEFERPPMLDLIEYRRRKGLE
jgi:glucosyl-3-phosphoglycerate synthase